MSEPGRVRPCAVEPSPARVRRWHADTERGWTSRPVATSVTSSAHVKRHAFPQRDAEGGQASSDPADLSPTSVSRYVTEYIEATRWRGGKRRQDMEPIEIGAVQIDGPA